MSNGVSHGLSHGVSHGVKTNGVKTNGVKEEPMEDNTEQHFTRYTPPIILKGIEWFKYITLLINHKATC